MAIALNFRLLFSLVLHFRALLPLRNVRSNICASTETVYLFVQNESYWNFCCARMPIVRAFGFHPWTNQKGLSLQKQKKTNGNQVFLCEHVMSIASKVSIDQDGRMSRGAMICPLHLKAPEREKTTSVEQPQWLYYTTFSRGPMIYCCVPFCRSSKNKKQPGVIFHEFPSDPVTRHRWLKAVARENVCPKGASATSVVCCLHFTADDYADGPVVCHNLKPGAVPSVFPGRPPCEPVPAQRAASGRVVCILTCVLYLLCVVG